MCDWRTASCAQISAPESWVNTMPRYPGRYPDAISLSCCADCIEVPTRLDPPQTASAGGSFPTGGHRQVKRRTATAIGHPYERAQRHHSPSLALLLRRVSGPVSPATQSFAQATDFACPDLMTI